MVAVRLLPGSPPPAPAPRLESAKGESGEDDADDAGQIYFDAHPESHGEKVQVDRGRRHQSDHRATRQKLTSVTSREKTAEQLSEEQANHETGRDHQDDQPDAALGRHRGLWLR